MDYTKRNFVFTLVISLTFIAQCAAASPHILKADSFKHYINDFTQNDDEIYIQHIPNDKAWAFLRDNIPLFECPDKDFERTYYFRFWTYRKHIKKTPDGYVITEFLPQVSWSGKHNTINCSAGHHFYEGRWIHNPVFLNDYAVFWFRKGGSLRSYSFWAADALYNRYLVCNDKAFITDMLPDLVKNYQEWETARLDPDGLFWQIDDRDGMEVSIGGNGKRVTINSYMYADATAIARIAAIMGKKDIADYFTAKAGEIKKLVQEKLWDNEAKFFKTLPRNNRMLVDVREQHGFTPWYVNLPNPDAGYEIAWKQLMDTDGFYAPFGPTTAEQRHERFTISYQGHECQWNGPSWPFSTSITLTALANVLNNYQQNIVTKNDYFECLGIYTRCHRLERPDGKIVPWIDENLNPYTGDWISRTRLKNWKNDTWDSDKGGRERGKDYNHSSYCDLIITGLAGLRPRPDDIVEVNSLLPAETWDWFCLDNILYHRHIITILWDRTGNRYNRGTGLRIFANGRCIAATDSLRRIQGKLPQRIVKTSANRWKNPNNPILDGGADITLDESVQRDDLTIFAKQWLQ